MNIAIIPAAGQGTRMGGQRPKQFLELAGTPIIVHTLRRFEECDVIDEVIVALPVAETAAFLELANKYSLRKLARVVPGSQTRAESVWRALQSVRAATAGVVAVHDGVRPFVTPDEIRQCVELARARGAAILVAQVTDTIKEVSEDQIVQTLDRTALRRALTPQCFQYSILRRAFERALDDEGRLGDEITDESFLVEQLGVKVATIEGDPRNIKITRAEDLVIAEAMLG